MRRAVLLAGVCFALAACVHTQEMPLAPNAVRLDTHATGLLFAGQAAPQTMRRAAQLTLQNGFTHFRFEQAQVSQGSEIAGVYSSATGNAYASSYGRSTLVTANASSFSTPIHRPTSDIGVTVIMFHADEAGAKGAFDAADVLSRAG